jgi:hypothetical protein
MPLSLTDHQLAAVTDAAALLPPHNFLRSVAAQLASPRPTDGQVLAALRFVLSERGVAVGREALAIKRR